MSWVTDDITLWRGKLLLKVIQDVNGGWAGFNFVVGISVLSIWPILQYASGLRKFFQYDFPDLHLSLGFKLYSFLTLFLLRHYF